jgi:hypothetical protein
MPKLHCPCGYVHNLSPIPDGGWLTLRDRDHDRLTPNASTPPDERLAVWQQIIGTSGRMYECPACGRLMWRLPRSEGGVDYRVYRPDLGD